MTTFERPADRGRRLARRSMARLADDFKLACVAGGLSQREVARAAGMSHSAVGRLQRGEAIGMSVEDAAALLALAGLDLRVSVVPGPTAHRDRAHAALLSRFKAIIHAEWDWRLEVPLPNSGDPRSWDAVMRGRAVRIAVEAETGPRDGQELQRRLALKRRDGGVDHVVLLLSDTRGNRAFLREYGPMLRVDFALPHRALAEALREGRDPGGSGILVL